MTKPTLTYFDFSGSRGEECRLALHVAGVDFIDNRIKPGPAWLELKPTTPFGSMPTLELPGKGTFAQSNAILTLVGRKHGLHPTDEFEAARHEALLAFAEDLRHSVSPVLRIKDEPERTNKRTEIATTTIPTWAGYVERQLGDGPYVAGAKLNVVDIKLYMVMRWFISGGVDLVPTTVFDAFPKLRRLYDAVADHAAIKAWQARQA
jgi:prostaglandin-H2 D-isomerase / glutathione transferase